MRFPFPSSLSARITIGFLVLVATFGGISLSTVITVDRLNQAIRITHGGYVQLALVSGDLYSQQSTLRGYLREELGEEHSERWARKRLQRLIDAREKLLQKAEEILRDARNIDGVRAKQFDNTTALVQEMRTLIDGSQSRYGQLLAHPPIGSDIDSPLRTEILAVQKEQLRVELQLGQHSERLKERETGMVLRLSDQLDEVSRKTWIFTLVFGVIAVALGILVTLGATLMLRPLHRLREAARRIASGDYVHRIPVRGPREIAELAEEFNTMGQAIADRSRDLVRTERLATAGRMAAMITHEVRNPLSSIGLNTELLEEELGALPAARVDEAQALCRAITAEVDRLADITEEYLQLARPPKPKLQDESLELLVKRVVDFTGDQLRDQGIDIQLQTEDGPKLALDEGQIRQALLNLIRNAADEISALESPKIRITVSHSDTNAALIVADNGRGIPADLIDSIFEAFVTDKTSGTGLGLAITRQIIDDHGGSIVAHNEKNPDNDNCGAVFTILLPYQSPA